MAGSLRQRGEDTWQLRVHVGTDPITKRKRYVSRTFHGTKRQAGRALAELVGLFGFQRGEDPPVSDEGTPGLRCEPTIEKRLRRH